MKRLVLILAVFSFCTVPLSARWAQIPLEELVQDSDLIVVGTLQRVSQYSQDGTDYGQGTILIHDVIWGVANPGHLLTLKWQNASAIACPRVEHRHNRTKGIWLLNIEEGQLVRADYPGRFVELKERRRVEQLLSRHKVSLRAARDSFKDDEPMEVSLVFRNATSSALEFPGVVYDGSQLLLSSDIGLALYGGPHKDPELIDSLPDRVVLSETLPQSRSRPGKSLE